MALSPPTRPKSSPCPCGSSSITLLLQGQPGPPGPWPGEPARRPFPPWPPEWPFCRILSRSQVQAHSGREACPEAVSSLASRWPFCRICQQTLQTALGGEPCTGRFFHWPPEWPPSTDPVRTTLSRWRERGGPALRPFLHWHQWPCRILTASLFPGPQE